MVVAFVVWVPDHAVEKINKGAGLKLEFPNTIKVSAQCLMCRFRLRKPPCPYSVIEVEGGPEEGRDGLVEESVCHGEMEEVIF